MASERQDSDCFSRSAMIAALAAIVIGFVARGGFGGLGLAILILGTFFGVWRFAYRRCVAMTGEEPAEAPRAAPERKSAAAAPAPKAPPTAQPKPAAPAPAAAPAVATPSPEALRPSAEMMRAAMALPTPTKPAMLDAPRGGAGDDLKKIKGVGAKLEAMLNRMGVHHYDQIANWTPAEVAWVDENLEGFKGRVTRDAWIAQARALAAGEAPGGSGGPSDDRPTLN